MPISSVSSGAIATVAVLTIVGHLFAGRAFADSPEASEARISPAAAGSVLDVSDSLSISFEGTYLYGPVGCYLQTPSGGQPGTTSVGRPTLEELGIDNASIFDPAMTLRTGRHEFFVGGQLIGLSGHATLAETLISQDHTFPAGTEVDADVQLNWYRAGYRYWFLFDTDDAVGSELAIAPSIGAGCFSFSYKLDGPGEADVDRSYTKGMPQVGLEAEWALSDRFSIVAGVLTSIPIDDTPFVLSTRLAGKYRVVDARSIKLDALVGVGYERLQYDDAKKQEMPNDIDVNLGPLLLLGIRAEL